MSSKVKTVESKGKTRNGVKRMGFVLLSILLEIGLIVSLMINLNESFEWINITTRVFSVILGLVIYGKHTTSSMKMPWIVLILALPIVGITLYLLIGLNGGTWIMRERYKKIDDQIFHLLHEDKKIIGKLAEIEPVAAGIATYISRTSSYPLYENTDITYYDDAAAGLEAQLTELKKAEKFIFMEYHAIENALSWGRIEEVLLERAEAGVEVRVFYDDAGSIGFINRDFAKRLEALGISCRVFNPFMPGLNIFLNNRDHRKITVVDGKVGFTGGYNLADEYFNITHPYGLWKDSGIRLEGDAVKSLTITFLEMWNAVKRSDKDDVDFEKYLPKYDYKAEGKVFVQPFADIPIDNEQVGEDVYISMADKAEKYCYFMTPYLIITDEMTRAISLAAKRGVDVRIITPGIPDKKMVYRVTRSFYNGLVRNGVRIYEWTPGFCHAKMSVTDDKMAVCGTINLDYRSLYHSFENGCFIVDKTCAIAIKEDFNRTFKQCREVTEEYKTGRKSVIRLGQLFLRLFAELL
nr:cardiolipin synthase [uncultured Catonella sp.]